MDEFSKKLILTKLLPAAENHINDIIIRNLKFVSDILTGVKLRSAVTSEIISDVNEEKAIQKLFDRLLLARQARLKLTTLKTQIITNTESDEYITDAIHEITVTVDTLAELN